MWQNILIKRERQVALRHSEPFYIIPKSETHGNPEAQVTQVFTAEVRVPDYGRNF